MLVAAVTSFRSQRRWRKALSLGMRPNSGRIQAIVGYELRIKLYNFHLNRHLEQAKCPQALLTRNHEKFSAEICELHVTALSM